VSRDLRLALPVHTSVDTLLAMTDEQKEAIKWRTVQYANSGALREVSLFLGTMGLPDTYVGVIFHWTDGTQLVGGIDPEGRMST